MNFVSLWRVERPRDAEELLGSSVREEAIPPAHSAARDPRVAVPLASRVAAVCYRGPVPRMPIEGDIVRLISPASRLGAKGQ